MTMAAAGDANADAKTVREITEQDSRRVYRLLADTYGFDAPALLAHVNALLKKNGIENKEYGFAKARPFLERMSVENGGFLELRVIRTSETATNVEVLVHRMPGWAGGPVDSAPTPDPVSAPEPDPTPAPAPAPGPEPAADAAGLDFASAVRRALELPDYVRAPLSDEQRAELGPEFFAFASFPNTSRSYLAPVAPEGTDLDRLLEDAWAAAWEASALRTFGGKVIFPLPFMRADGTTPVEVNLRRSSRDLSKPWYVNYIDSEVRSVASASPSRALEEFAYLGTWDQFLDGLAAKALDEDWGGDVVIRGAAQRHPILKSFITTIFYRLKQEGKVLESSDGQFAAFNTNLVDRRYDDVYAVFERNTFAGKQPWKFASFCVAAEGYYGKLLVDAFARLPEPPSFFDDPRDLLYDLGRSLTISHRHFLIDNIDRLPLKFLRGGLRYNDEGVEIIDRIEASGQDREGRAEAYRRLRTVLDEDDDAYDALNNRFKSAVDRALARVRWNYKTAIPMYYPRKNKMSLLLPICLLREGQADVALVVERVRSQNYIGQTILTMRQAYQDARLVCRPDSDWLTPASRSENEVIEEF